VFVVLSVQTYADLANDPPTYTYIYDDPNHLFSEVGATTRAGS
jgi:hypothetical protein